ncbi:MAG: hypothetical protein PHW79_00815 [Candidatus Marinimicrobia bacterium]|nr:hypothetical protein [Candidatus Neomarinimicrobiota bacterium]
MRSDKIIYSIQIADVQTVAEQELDRKLTQAELKLVADAALENDYFEWYDGIVGIFEHLKFIPSDNE